MHILVIDRYYKCANEALDTKNICKQTWYLKNNVFRNDNNYITKIIKWIILNNYIHHSSLPCIILPHFSFNYVIGKFTVGYIWKKNSTFLLLVRSSVIFFIEYYWRTLIKMTDGTPHWQLWGLYHPSESSNLLTSFVIFIFKFES